MLGRIEYKEETGELFLGLGRIVKKIHIRNSTSSILSLSTEDTITQISVDGELLLALDAAGRIYLYSLSYHTEIGRMLSKGCQAAVVKDGKIYLEYTGYLQEWVAEDNGFFAFAKTKHITGHRDSITMIQRAPDGLLTGGYDGALRFADLAGSQSASIRTSKGQAIAAKKTDNEVVAVWNNGEISRHALDAGKWVTTMRKFTMLNLISADVSRLGDLVVAVDSNHNVLLFSARTEDRTPLHQIFVSTGVTHATLVEGDEWIVLSGAGVVIWEWRTNLLLFNEQSSSPQVCAQSTATSIITGTESGDIFVWDRSLSTCSQRLSEYNSAVIGIVPTARGFVSASREGVCKLHKPTGEAIKSITAEINLTAFDADDELLAVAGPRHLEMYDLKRSKKIAAAEIGFPLSVKILGNAVMVACMEVLFVVGADSTTTKNLPEPCTAASIQTVGGATRVICIGESGMMYLYNEELEEVAEFRALPKYVNGIGRTTPLSLVMAADSSIVLTYRLVKPDRRTTSRTSLCAAIFQAGFEIDKWVVLEKDERGSGQAFVSLSEYGTAVGVCTSSGVLVFSDKQKGFKPVHLWQTETPEQVAAQIEKGDALLGAIGATRLQSTALMRLAVEASDPEVLGKYFPADLTAPLFPLILSLITDGMVEKPLSLLKEVLKRVPPPALLGRQLFLALNQSFEISVATTGYADALLAYPQLSSKASPQPGAKAAPTEAANP